MSSTSSFSVCVYCGSGDGRDPAYARAAGDLGREFGRNGVRLIYGGGSTGLMGIVARATLESGGEAVGIIPQFLVDRERAMQGLTELVVTQDMHERKWAMFERADAFVALPGGIGTLEELIEILTWAQLGRHSKPIAIANIGGFWNPLAALIEHMKAETFIHSQDLLNPLFIDTVEDVLPALRNETNRLDRQRQRRS